MSDDVALIFDQTDSVYTHGSQRRVAAANFSALPKPRV